MQLGDVEGGRVRQVVDDAGYGHAAVCARLHVLDQLDEIHKHQLVGRREPRDHGHRSALVIDCNAEHVTEVIVVPRRVRHDRASLVGHERQRITLPPVVRPARDQIEGAQVDARRRERLSTLSLVVRLKQRLLRKQVRRHRLIDGDALLTRDRATLHHLALVTHRLQSLRPRDLALDRTNDRIERRLERTGRLDARGLLDGDGVGRAGQRHTLKLTELLEYARAEVRELGRKIQSGLEHRSTKLGRRRQRCGAHAVADLRDIKPVTQTRNETGDELIGKQQAVLQLLDVCVLGLEWHEAWVRGRTVCHLRCECCVRRRRLGLRLGLGRTTGHEDRLELLDAVRKSVRPLQTSERLAEERLVQVVGARRGALHDEQSLDVIHLLTNHDAVLEHGVFLQVHQISSGRRCARVPTDRDAHTLDVHTPRDRTRRATHSAVVPLADVQTRVLDRDLAHTNHVLLAARSVDNVEWNAKWVRLQRHQPLHLVATDL